MTPTKRSWLTSLGVLALLGGCMPDVPPEADPPEVEVSGGELPEYEYDAAELEERSEDRPASNARRETHARSAERSGTPSRPTGDGKRRPVGTDA